MDGCASEMPRPEAQRFTTKRRWWGSGGPRTEPGHFHDRRDWDAQDNALRASPWCRDGEKVPQAFTPGGASSSSADPAINLYQEKAGSLFLNSLQGQWKVSESTCSNSWDAGVWTIEQGGRCLFNGKHFGTEYDLFEPPSETHSSGMAYTLQRNDGWTANVHFEATAPTLVWTLAGCSGHIIWKRMPTAFGEDELSAGGVRESKTELRSKIQASFQQMSDEWESEGRRSSAVAVMEEIPRRISDDMQRMASHFVDSVQTEVAAMSKQIRDGEKRGSMNDASGCAANADATEKVVKNLEVLPTMVRNLLEARVDKARAQVRHRVRGMLQNLSAIQEEN